jgi:septal ring factor EnvC (AmiA/AmiB activator)
MVTRVSDAMGTYELNYSEIIAPVVKSIQQQEEEITDDKAGLKQQTALLTSQIADLEQEIATLEKEIADLKAPAH